MRSLNTEKQQKPNLKPIWFRTILLFLAVTTCFASAGSLETSDTNSSQQSSHKIYKNTLPNGSVEFSDMPSDSNGSSSEVIDPKPIPTLNFKEVKTTNHSSRAKNKGSGGLKHPSISITSPSDQQTLRNIGGQLPVSVTLRPRLYRGYQVIVLLNGVKVAGPSSSTQLTASNVFRGEHTLTANILDPSGEVVGSSEGITIFVHQ